MTFFLFDVDVDADAAVFLIAVAGFLLFFSLKTSPSTPPLPPTMNKAITSRSGRGARWWQWQQIFMAETTMMAGGSFQLSASAAVH